MTLKIDRRRLLHGLGVLLVLALCVVVALLLQRSRERVIDDLRNDTRTLTTALALYARELVSTIDLTLAEVRDGLVLLEHSGGAASRAPLGDGLLRAAQARIGLSATLRVLDAQGHAAYGANAPAGEEAGSDYFQAHVARDAGLFIGALQRSAADGRATIVFSRRLSDADGCFRGVVLLSVPMQAFDALFERFDVGEHGTLILADDRGVLLARRPAAPALVGTKFMRDDGPALRALRSGVRAGVNIGVAPADGVLRMLSFERVGGTRLVVGIGQSLDEHLAGWRREASVYGTVTALFGVLALCMLWRGAWHARRLQRSEALTRSILAQAPDAFISMDHRGRITDWNAQAEATFGWRRGEVLGRTVAELLVPPRLREQHEAGLRDFVRSGTGAVINRRLRMPALHRRGHEIPVELSIAAVRNGDVFTANAFLHDVTLLEDAERARAVEERRTRTITDNLPVLISYIDKEHRLLFCNATYKDWLGLEPAEAVGRPLLQAIGPTLYEQCRAHLERALAGERVDFELQSQARGVTRHLQNVYIPDVDADGNVAGIYTLSTDVTALKSVERRLSQLAHVDALTGLPNRRQFEQMLQLSLARCQRGDRPFALAFLDLDHFKPINDKHGHATGDAVLREVAARLHNCVRQTDAVGRLAGDEFVVILAGVHSSEQADRAARKIAGCFAEPVVVGPLTLQVSCSIGLALFAGEDITPGEAMSRADQALYRAKREGRSKFAMFA